MLPPGSTTEAHSVLALLSIHSWWAQLLLLGAIALFFTVVGIALTLYMTQRRPMELPDHVVPFRSQDRPRQSTQRHRHTYHDRSGL